MILNSIRAAKMKFASDYGDDVVLAIDSNQGYWRRKVFPYYKAGRKKDRDESSLNWDEIFTSVNKIIEEIKENFPYRVIRVPGAEADDVIAVLAKKHHTAGVMIVARDKDSIQLHQYPGIKQWDTVKKKFVKHPDPIRHLQEDIIRGGHNGVPSILEKDNALVVREGRRPSITQKKIDKWLSGDPQLTMSSEEYRNWIRNRELIDCSFIPEDIQEAILAEYEAEGGKGRSKIFNYFFKNKLKKLNECITDF